MDEKVTDCVVALGILRQLAGNWGIGPLDAGRWFLDGTVDVDEMGRDLLQRLYDES